MIAAKAFEELERREKDPNDLVAKAKSSACIGVVKMFSTGKCSADELREAIRILEREKSASATNILSVIKKWAAEVNVYF